MLYLLIFIKIYISNNLIFTINAFLISKVNYTMYINFTDYVTVA